MTRDLERSELAQKRLLQDRLKYVFSDQRLLALALTHRSFSAQNNERLEFLGDAVLGSIIAHYLYRHYPQLREGEMSRMRAQIVRAESLASVGKRLDLGSCLLLGSGEMKAGGKKRDSILGDAVEAIIGAVYIDSGADSSNECVLRWFKEELIKVSYEWPSKDSKTKLQEWLQKKGQPLPYYRLIDTSGEAHSRTFTVECVLSSIDIDANASASSVKKAEQIVAEKLLIAIGEI